MVEVREQQKTTNQVHRQYLVRTISLMNLVHVLRMQAENFRQLHLEILSDELIKHAK